MTWEWRIALGGFTPPADHRDGVGYFHAYDMENKAACEPLISLIESCGEPTEGDRFCPDCLAIVVRQRAARRAPLVRAT